MTTTKKETPKITAKVLEEMFSTDIYDAIAHIDTLSKSYPIVPSRPKLASTHTSAEAQEYSNSLKAYESAKEDYDKVSNAIRAYNGELDVILEEYIKNISGLKIHVPTDKQDKVYSYAYSENHSEGMASVYHKLRDIVNLFQ